jgi:TorA maturation chaperone TorD
MKADQKPICAKNPEFGKKYTKKGKNAQAKSTSSRRLSRQLAFLCKSGAESPASFAKDENPDRLKPLPLRHFGVSFDIGRNVLVPNTQVRETVSDSELMRASLYRLLARALAAPADTEFLNALKKLEGDETAIGQNFRALQRAAAMTDVKSAAEEYQNLFIGIGRGELVPFASYYLTGFLNEKPLARLRNDMGELGIARSSGTKEPEDHAAAILEMMAGLIDGSFGAALGLGKQSEFFAQHVASWMPHFFKDLARARNARLLAPVGTIGMLYMEIEQAAFEM